MFEKKIAKEIKKDLLKDENSKLQLERNTLQKENEKLKKIIDIQYKLINDYKANKKKLEDELWESCIGLK